MSARPAECNAKATTAQRPVDDRGNPTAFKCDRRGDVVLSGKNMPHAAQVSCPFLADVRSEQDGAGRGKFGILQRSGDGQQGGKAGGVVAGSGSKDAGAVFL